ncbi:hypothetical protein Salat_0862100 [Sesamum alatum]|uniref:Uncharacterized protein n=1 Tax=Sesamum alatum TaxID=300844 RepID=A0AAE2CQP0_9LAMI|nr:hypothetical protein Salat_0862100 [Sesamum alatum]
MGGLLAVPRMICGHTARGFHPKLHASTITPSALSLLARLGPEREQRGSVVDFFWWSLRGCDLVILQRRLVAIYGILGQLKRELQFTKDEAAGMVMLDEGRPQNASPREITHRGLDIFGPLETVASRRRVTEGFWVKMEALAGASEL